MYAITRKIPVAFSLLALSLAAGPVSAESDPLAGLDAYITESMAEWQVPGLAITVVNDDSAVLLRGYGIREAGTTAAVDERTVFAIGSNAKAFAAATVAMLVDEGKLSWDDPVTQHLPWFQLPDPWVTGEVTIRDLLAHRLGGDVGRRDGRLYYFPPVFEREEVLRRLRFLEVDPPRFRSQFMYCNACYIAAGEIVAAVSKMSWDEFVKKRIFMPLEMTTAATSAYQLWDAEDVAPCWICGVRDRTVHAQDARSGNIVMPHILVDNELQPIPWISSDAAGPAGGISASATDLAKWVRLLLGAGSYKGDVLLSTEAISEMYSAQMLRPPPGWHPAIAALEKDPTGDIWAAGFGWHVGQYRGEKLVFHGGGQPGQASFIALLPEQGLGVAVVSNRGRGNALPIALGLRVLDEHLGAQSEDWSAILLADIRAWEAEKRARAAAASEAPYPGAAPSFPPERYVGTYSHPGFGQLEIAARSGDLLLKYSDQLTWPLERKQADTLEVEFDNGADKFTLSLVFEIGEDGVANALSFGGPRFERIASRNER